MSWRVGGHELIWHGDPVHWSRRAPILFPVVGASVGGAVRVAGLSYPMPQHGFARDAAFALAERTDSTLRLRLTDTVASRAHYPFAFVLDVVADVAPTTLAITFDVANPGAVGLPYAIGFHPAFPWPLASKGDRDGHTVVFDEAESPSIPDVVSGGLLKLPGRPLAFNGRTLPLDPAMFTEALVFLDAKSRRFAFHAPGGGSLAMSLDDFPHLAVWSRPTAPFVSLECWTGHADIEGFAGELSERASIRVLAPGAAARHAVTLSWDAASAG